MRKAVPGRYKPHESLKSDLCWYCERPGEVIDHFPPISREAEVPQIQGWLVLSCARCNLELGDMQHLSLSSRRFYIHEWLSQKQYLQERLLEGASVAELSRLSGWSVQRLCTVRDEGKKDKQRDLDKLAAERLVKTTLKDLLGDEND